MSLPKPVANDADKPIDINFAGQTPHVFAYRMWYRRPGEESWTKFAEGHTEDDQADHHRTGPHPDGTKIASMVAVGGKKSSLYRFLLIFSQDGQVVQGGIIRESGKTSADGGALKSTRVVLV